jgi:glycosyltransferase involved in cell wall biosynthesis
VLLTFLHHPKFRWVKYAGNWRPNSKEAWSYTFQRWWLNKGLHRGVVTVNGRWPHQPKHVYSFLNPCLTHEEVESARTVASSKELSPPYNLLFVGRVESAKGVGRFLKIAKELHRQGIPIKVDIVGDGPERKGFEAWTEANGLSSFVTFHGWLPKPALAEFYARAHFLVFPSSSEGWPKVLSEAMAHGAVPIAGAVSSIPQILSETNAGLSFPSDDIHAFVQAILDFIDHPERWRAASQAGVSVAPLFTYEHYLEAVKQMFWDAWKVKL